MVRTLEDIKVKLKDSLNNNYHILNLMDDINLKLKTSLTLQEQERFVEIVVNICLDGSTYYPCRKRMATMIAFLEVFIIDDDEFTTFDFNNTSYTDIYNVFKETRLISRAMQENESIGYLMSTLYRTIDESLESCKRVLWSAL